MTSVTEGAKGRQSPGFFTYSNKRWRLPLFLFFCDESQLIDGRLNVFSGRKAALLGLPSVFCSSGATRHQSLKWAASLGRLCKSNYITYGLSMQALIAPNIDV